MFDPARGVDVGRVVFHLNTVGTAINPAQKDVGGGFRDTCIGEGFEETFTRDNIKSGAKVKTSLQTTCEWEAGASSFTLVQAASVAHAKVLDKLAVIEGTA